MLESSREAAITLVGFFILGAVACTTEEPRPPAEGPSIEARVPQSCTVFLISDGESVLGGGNEDQAAFPARAWFLPAEEGKHGRFYVGFEGVVESGMNDQGLFYDSLAAPNRTVEPEEGKPLQEGMWTLRALETCTTVGEVVELLESISVPGAWTDQLFFGDGNGDSIIVEGDMILRSEGGRQTCTNFLQSRAIPDSVSCSRFLTVERMLDEMEPVSPEAVRDVFAAVAATSPSGAGTSYTTIYDPRDKTATCFLWRDFEHGIVFDLAEELAKGPHVVELAEVARPNPIRDAWVAEARSELDRAIEARMDWTVDLDESRGGLVGHYAVDPAIGVVPFPPAMIHGVSIVSNRDLPQLVVVSEGACFDLRPAGDDVWFHANVSSKPEMDLILERDEAGEVRGLTLKLIGLGDIPFVKVSETPLYQPLPSRTLPAEAESAGSKR